MDNHEIGGYAHEVREQLEQCGSCALERTDRADRFSDFGFQMDCGQSFLERYGSLVDDMDVLQLNLDYVDDIQVLGNAVFSQCRYITHWTMGGCPREFEWLKLALKRLEGLAEEAQSAAPLMDKRDACGDGGIAHYRFGCGYFV